MGTLLERFEEHDGKVYIVPKKKKKKRKLNICVFQDP